MSLLVRRVAQTLDRFAEMQVLPDAMKSQSSGRLGSTHALKPTTVIAAIAGFIFIFFPFSIVLSFLLYEIEVDP